MEEKITLPRLFGDSGELKLGIEHQKNLLEP